ncbi:class I SAM-dependent methyltransferase [Azohydromonas lata]|uniref:class I SAM-dependent methyltransferase n=1 Tax=Azohydromonas lata TaxID=45677 RepID=UPI00082A10CF|nr:class I SAM-dependent methyltransferase [Azohydromonas lata]
MHSSSSPADAASPWIRRFTPLLPAGCSVLDVACGGGRHVHWFAQRGHEVVALDRDAEAVAPLRGIARVVVADIENGPWPLPGERFGAVVVTNYLWRPLLPRLLESLQDGGVLLYETFAAGNETVGRPRSPDFLLRPGELLDVARGLRVVAFEDGFLQEPARFVQRIAAVREAPPAPDAAPARRLL